MLVVARVLAFLAGSAIVVGTLASAVKTVVMPRAEPALITRWVFVSLRKPFDWRVRHADDWAEADRTMARFGPFAMILLPWAWLTITLLAFVPIYWALGTEGPRDALILSGSSLLTLGFAFDHDGPAVAASFVQATLGLGLVALLISFLPTIYQQFSRREVLVSQLDTRAGTPPTPLALFRRAERIGWVDNLDEFWGEWERWFAEIEESHTTYPALPFFRSPRPERSWITAAGAVLDSAALRASTLDLPASWEAQLCLRSGYLALRAIADSYDVDYDPDPSPDDPISITREEFDELIADLVAVDVVVKDDVDQAWQDFAGWRVNYDTVLLALSGLVMAPYAPWSSDRSLNYRLRLLHGRRARRWRNGRGSQGNDRNGGNAGNAEDDRGEGATEGGDPPGAEPPGAGHGGGGDDRDGGLR